MKRVVDRLSRYWKEWRHDRVARGVLATPPLLPRDDGVVLFSMIGTRVLNPYLVAVKSFHHHLGRGRVVILDDGTLTAADRAVLAHHLGDPAIIAIADVETGGCPRGGAWERLLAILDARAGDYVIQLDSDTVTLGPVPEVAAAIDGGRDFSLRGDASVTLMPVDAFVASRPPLGPSPHIQNAIEHGLDTLTLPGLPAPRYFRGCAGFAGFAPGGAGRGRAIAFSAANEAALGKARWAEWGTEQVTSNFIVANGTDPMLLPYERYMNFWDEGVPADARLVHFLGTNRFTGSAYADATRAAIGELAAA